MSDDTPPLIRALLRPDAWPEGTPAPELVETHISWVILAGDQVYKIKKPLDLGFLDFSSLDKRLAACRQELRLNRRFAPELYLDLTPIAGTPLAPRLGGDGIPFEYAVRMRRFPQSAQLDRLLAAGELRGQDLEGFGRRMAQLHAAAPVAPAGSDYGSPAQVRGVVEDSFDDLLRDPPDAEFRHRLLQLRDRMRNQAAALAPVFARRKREGRVREGHGDLHLANLVRLGGQVLAFDCIEFSAALRWNDVIGDIAFLAMDLAYRGRSDLAWLFLNAYLQAGGDYDGARVLHWYLVYRALVRAKVEAIRARGLPATERPPHHAAARAYLELARSWADPPRPALILMHGLSGSGKSWISARLAAQWPAIRIRSDVERKRLHGLAPEDRSGSTLGTGIYAPGATQRCYAQVAEQAEAVLEGGQTAIVDAAFLLRTQRDRFRELAARRGLPCLIVECRAPQAELERRLRARGTAGADPSEADVEVLRHQLRSQEMLDDGERTTTVTVDATAGFDARTTLAALLQLAGAAAGAAH